MCDEIRIYVADLEAYNNGKLHGVWINATQDLESIYAEIHEMLKNSPEPFAEEWEIHDYEGFGDYQLGPYISVESAREIALFIEEHEEAALAALEYTDDLDTAKEMVEDCYYGCHDSKEAFAEQLFDDCYDIPSHLQNYIDYERVARDLFMDGYVSVELNGQVHVFTNC